MLFTQRAVSRTKRNVIADLSNHYGSYTISRQNAMQKCAERKTFFVRFVCVRNGQETLRVRIPGEYP